MQYIYQFLIIGGITFIGELCNLLLPLPVPSSVYGMIIMFVCLVTGVIKEKQIKETADFLLLIMPIMFIGPAVGVMENYLAISNNIIQFMLVVFITTVVIMIVTGLVSETLLKEVNIMNNLLLNSAYFGIVLSLLAYFIGDVLKKKTKIALFNPLLVSSVLIIIFLLIFDIDYRTFNEGAKYLTYLLTPATVCLALPLYRQYEILKRNVSVIFISILSGCLTCFILIIGIDILIHLDKALFLSLLPKSITTAIAIGVTEEIGGISGITVAAVIITGIFSAMIATTVFKIFHINHPIAKGLALGTSGHAIGTSKAIELGEVEAAMSSLAIVVTGIMTVILVPILVSFYY